MDEIDIAKLKEKDELALSAFYNTIVPKISRVVTRTLSDRPAVEIEAVVDEVISRILSNFDVILKQDDTSIIQAYCTKIARNIALEFRSRIQKEARYSEVSIEELERIPIPEAEEPVVSDEQLEAFHKFLDSLPLADRQLIEYRIAGNDYRELAAQMGISHQALRIRYLRLIRRLRTYLEVAELHNEQ